MRYIVSLVSLLLSLTANAQISRLGDDLKYCVELSGQVGDGESTPFWQMSNRSGLACVDNNSGYLRAGIMRDVHADSLRNWRVGYAADFVVPAGFSSKFILQQCFVDVRYKALGLLVGQKENGLELKNDRLSSGAMTLGMNARPVPQVKLGLPEFWIIPRTGDWLALKGFLSYGMYTDNRWQRNFNAGNSAFMYTQNSLYHSKAAYIRVGNTEKFPVKVTGGIEMISQFGGKVWNRIQDDKGNFINPYNLNGGVKDFFHALVPTGSDVTDGDNPNVMGNHLGSYLLRADYESKGWGASFYCEHFFEDHSMMAFKFSWKDMLYGAELKFPKNPVMSSVLYEYIRTTDQSGPVFENSINGIKGIGGVDDYYNHGIYGAYQHAGFVMGTPLLLSPVYNKDGNINCYDNRITANHFGFSGNPSDEFSYRLLYTREKSWGSYKTPRTDPAVGHFFLAELCYMPQKVQGLGVTLSYGQNAGELLGKSKGAMLTVSYSGLFRKK